VSPRELSRWGVTPRWIPFMKTFRIPDPDADLEWLEMRLGPAPTRRRLDVERDHEAKAHGLTHRAKPMMIDAVLRMTGTYWWGHANARKVQLRRNEVRLPRLPKAFDGFTILHLSDLHADMSVEAMERVTKLVQGLEYDLCVMTGDYRGRTCGDHKPCLEGVSRVREALHSDTYAVLGNHDPIAIVPDLEALDIGVLLNESAVVERGEAAIYLAGVDDAHSYQTDDIEKAAALIPKGSVKILLSHTPEIFREAASAGFDLMLSGHTHGGQICLPGGVAILLEAHDLPRAFAAGAWRYADMAGYTSVGAGSCLVPVRFNSRPEITLHRLVVADF
jgi:predicted MPP superfamily phosphohydrolase